jgi:hypothetical protein
VVVVKRMSGSANVGLGRIGTRPKKALVFAWMVEALAVIMGLVLAVFAGIEGSDSGAVAMAIAILPFAALAIIELTKIPLIALAFEVRGFLWKLVALVALVFVVGATFENFVFGFERGFNERIRTVEKAEQEVKSAKSQQELARTRVPQMTARQTEITARLAVLRDEATAIRQQAQQDIADTRGNNTAAGLRAEREQVERDIVAIDQRRDADLNRERARCRVPNVPCNISAITNNYARQRAGLAQRITALMQQQREQDGAASIEVASARQKRDANLAEKERERTTLQTELNAVREQLVDAQQVLLEGTDRVAAAEHHRDEMIERSQLHRLSMVLFGSHERATLEETKRLFVVSLSAIVAVIGALIAAMHFAADLHAQREAEGAFGKVARPPPRRLISKAVRGLLARRRRRLPVGEALKRASRERRGLIRNIRGIAARRRLRTEIVTIKEVPKEVFVDRLKIVYLPLDATEEEVARARRDAERDIEGARRAEREAA